MSYFPFFVEIGQKRCLVVGGGTVAFRKIEKLLPFGVEITVVSPSFCAEIEQTEGICRIRKEFQAEDVEDMCFVIGATDCEAVNARIAAVCHAKHIQEVQAPWRRASSASRWRMPSPQALPM